MAKKLKALCSSAKKANLLLAPVVGVGCPGIIAEDGVSQCALRSLQVENFFFDGVARDEPQCDDPLVLPNAVAPVDCLCLDG